MSRGSGREINPVASTVLPTRTVFLNLAGAPDEWRRDSASEMQQREGGMEMDPATSRPVCSCAEHLLAVERKRGVLG